MKLIEKNNFNHILIFLSPFFFFFLGYISKFVLGFNFDIFYVHSVIITISIILFLILDILLKSFRLNFYIRISCLSIISCGYLAIFLSIIQNDLIDTRWLELGKFSKNDAQDYFDQSIEYLFKNEFYSKKGRIIAPILFSGLLGELYLNVNNVQILLTFLTCIITFYASILIYKNYGYGLALLFSALSVDYIAEHVGGFSTEIVGYILGATAFIFFLRFKLSKISNINNYYIFLLFILLGYLVRPSYPFVLPALLLWSFLYVKKIKLINIYKFILISISIISLVFFTNRLILEKKAPISAKTFGNVYDSWYANHELGKFIIKGRYKELPGLLWTQIIEQNPELKSLTGDEAVKLKQKIFFDSLLKNPEYYFMGSFVQIIKFFEVSKMFKEQFHNTAGFLHIEFDFFRSIILILFLLTGIISIFNFFTGKGYIAMLPGFIFLAVLLSQPLIFGGESRVAAPVIFIINYIIILFLNKLIEQSKYKFKSLDFNKNKSCKLNLPNPFTFVLIIPSVVLFFFFVQGLLNNFNYLKTKNQLQISCPEGYQAKEIMFNYQSGFFLNGANSKKDSKGINFDEYMQYIINQAVIHMEFKILNFSIEGMTKADIYEKDDFKFLQPFFTSINTRLLGLSPRANDILVTLANQYIAGGGYFVNPINKSSNKLEGLVILKKDMFKKGFNHLKVCL